MKKILIVGFVLGVCITAASNHIFGQCRTADKDVQKSLGLAKGKKSVIVKDTIRLCTAHIYRFRASAGQTLNVKLTTGKKTGLTIMPPSGEALVDGNALTWSGKLSEGGEYEIQIGTDVAARYTLAVSVK